MRTAKYKPGLTDKEIRENHKIFARRVAMYKKKGLDFRKARRFILEKARPIKGGILEIGAGTGHTALTLAKAGYKFVSIDSDKSALKTAALNLAYYGVLGRARLYAMDGKDIKFPAGHFGNVIAVSLFHHIKGVRKMFSEIDRVLKPGGKAILADFNKKGMKIINSTHRSEGRHHEDTGVTRDEAARYFAKLGYRVKKYNEKSHWFLIAVKPGRHTEETPFDRYYERYDRWYDRHGFAHLSEIAAIKKLLPGKGKGLEIGVGTGRFARPLGIDYGIDPSEKMLKLARKRNIKVRTAEGEKLPFRKGSFDYVVIIITLCFVKNPLRTLKESGRVLKENGRIVIGIVDKNSFLGRHYRKKKSVFYKTANFFSVRELKRLLKKAGFKAFRSYQTLFCLPERVRSVQRPRKGYGRGGFVAVSADAE